MHTSLFFGGTILTMEETVRGDAVLVKDGMIAAVGSREELEPFARGAERINLDGAVLMPAFIDTHSHFTQMAHSFLQVSLEGVSSAEELIHRIQLYIEKTKPCPGQWILARDYDQNLFPDRKNPSLQVLDEASAYPMMIQHKSGHMGLMNSSALCTLGISEKTESPSGGRIGRENGKLTGYLEENAFFTYAKKVPLPDEKQLEEAYRKAQQAYASYGITTIQEGMLVKEMMPLYHLLLQRDILQLDLVAYLDRESYTMAKDQMQPYRKGYHDHFRIGGMKIFLDGSPQGRTAWMKTPYIGTDDCGYGTMTDEEVCNAMAAAESERVQLLAHCNGDAAAEQFLRCLARMEADFPALARLRPVIIHGQLIEVEQMKRAAGLGAVISFFAAHVYHWGDTHIRNFGLERAARISPAASALKVGVPFTFHQDAPVIQPDMWETVWCAVNRITRGGTVLGAEEKIPVYEALLAVTRKAAWQYGEEQYKGSIRPGKQADLIVTDRNPLTAAPEELRDVQVLQTYKSGICLYSASENPK